MTDQTSTTKRLISLAQRGDRGAQETLFARSYGDLLQAARFRLGPALRARLEASDLVQSVYEKALGDLSLYRYRGKGSFQRWLLKILENQIRNTLAFLQAKRRDLRREVALDTERPILAPVTSPTRKLLANETRERLEKAMDQLQGAAREIIICRYYLGMAWHEIADGLGISEEAAQMRCHRALLKLKKLYQQKS